MEATVQEQKNVYELTQERLRVIFNEFDNIYVSFSGGKDSGVLLNLCIDYIRRNNLKAENRCITTWIMSPIQNDYRFCRQHSRKE